VARRSEAVVDVVEAETRRNPFGPMQASTPEPPAGAVDAARALSGPAALAAVARITGGQVFQTDPVGDFAGAFVAALQAFRNGYVLSYSPQGVAPDGWHVLGVGVMVHQEYVVRARSGYEGGSATR
jgi:hypothetical protein